MNKTNNLTDMCSHFLNLNCFTMTANQKIITGKGGIKDIAEEWKKCRTDELG